MATRRSHSAARAPFSLWMSVSAKVALCIIVVAAVCALITLGPGFSWQAAQTRASYRATHQEALELLALALAPALPSGDHELAQAAADNVANFPERYPAVKALEVLDREGRVIADLDPRRFNTRATDPSLAEDLKQRRPRMSLIAEDRMSFVVPIRGTHTLGVLRATLDESALSASLRRSQRTVAGWVALLGLIMGSVLYLLLRRLLGRRVEDLAAVADRLGAGDLEARADHAGRDELATLAGRLNTMAQDLSQHRGNLESLVAERTDALAEANERLAELATTDALTGLHNRRYLEAHAQRLLAVARRSGRPLSLVMLDLDHFKRVNDTYGHAVGDAVLKGVAATLRGQAREADIVARIGGEELVVAMPDTDLAAGMLAAERLRVRIAESEPGGCRVTASFGVANCPLDGTTLEQLFESADRALYAAKAAGRDRVMNNAELAA